MLADLIPSVVSGFFSRTCFYVFDQELEWKNQFTDKHYGASNRIISTGSLLVKIFKHNRKYSVEITLTKSQKNKHTQLYRHWTQELKNSNIDREYFASIARNGRVFFRIVMILLAIRRYEDKDKKNICVCSNRDFKIAERICSVLHEHSKTVFVYLSRGNRASAIDYKIQFLNVLPYKFRRAKAIEIGKPMEHEERTVDKWLKEWLEEGKLRRPKQGIYIKCTKSANVAKLADRDSQILLSGAPSPGDRFGMFLDSLDR